MHKILATQLKARPDLALLSLDATDAFQHVKREALWHALQCHIPGIMPYMMGLIPNEGDLVYQAPTGQTTVYTQTTGIYQGCALSATLFCMVLDLAIAQIAQQCKAAGIPVGLYAYIDDLSIAAPPAHAQQVMTISNDCLANIGFRVNMDKRTIWCEDASKIPTTLMLQQVSAPTILRLTEKPLGATPLDSPTDADGFCATPAQDPAVTKAVERRETTLRRIVAARKAGLSVQHTFTLLRYATAGDITWLARTTGLPTSTARQMDEALQAVIIDLLGLQDADPTTDLPRIWHSWRKGGLGFQSAQEVRQTAPIASWAACERTVLRACGLVDREDLLKIRPEITHTLQEVQRAQAEITQEPATDALPEEDRLGVTQATIRAHRQADQWQQWMRTTPLTVPQLAWITSCAGPGSAAWLRPPTRQSHEMEDAHFLYQPR